GGPRGSGGERGAPEGRGGGGGGGPPRAPRRARRRRRPGSAAPHGAACEAPRRLAVAGVVHRPPSLRIAQLEPCSRRYHSPPRRAERRPPRVHEQERQEVLEMAERLEPRETTPDEPSGQGVTWRRPPGAATSGRPHRDAEHVL